MLIFRVLSAIMGLSKFAYLTVLRNEIFHSVRSTRNTWQSHAICLLYRFHYITRLRLFCDAQATTMRCSALSSSKSGLWITGALRKIRGWIFPKKRFVRIFIWQHWIFHVRVLHTRVKHDAIWFPSFYTVKFILPAVLQGARKCIF